MFCLYLILAYFITVVFSIFVDCGKDPSAKPEPSSFTILCFFVGFIWWLICLFCKEYPLLAFGPYAAATAINIIRLLNFRELLQFIGKVGP